jgi:hypothetical protein
MKYCGNRGKKAAARERKGYTATKNVGRSIAGVKIQLEYPGAGVR